MLHKRIALLAGILIAVLMAGVAHAAAGWAMFAPDTAAPGTVVHVTLEPYNCDGWDAETLAVRLTHDGGSAIGQAKMHRNGPQGEFQFAVPLLPPGKYWASVECTPGDWLPVSTNGGDGAPGDPFTVRAGTPETATASSDGIARGGPPGSLTLAIAVVAGLSSTALVLRRRLSANRAAVSGRVRAGTSVDLEADHFRGPVQLPPAFPRRVSGLPPQEWQHTAIEDWAPQKPRVSDRD